MASPGRGLALDEAGEVAEGELADAGEIGAKWEDTPAGWPQTPSYAWWRKHDECDVPAA